MRLLSPTRSSAAALTAAAALLLLPLTGCNERDDRDRRVQEQASEAGEQLEEAGREVGKTAEVIGERVGEAVEEGRERTGEALERIGRDLQQRRDGPDPTTRPADPPPEDPQP